MNTICALATPMGVSAIGVVKMSGTEALEIADRCFTPAKGVSKVAEAEGYRLLYGWWKHPGTGETIDDVVLSVFRAPHSYTGDDVVEIACHGSTFILQEVIQSLLVAGCRMAAPGEFTQRAFAAGKMDLSQAEAVADLISSRTRSSARMALTQMRGGFRKKIEATRETLLHFCALMELELDFPEEDVEFADRSELIALCSQQRADLQRLADSFSRGAVLKSGIPVAIVGSTNAGKSSLLNLILGEDKAIVTDIHGTTRDTIEDTVILDGKEFRLIDTAGIRETTDTVEEIGIQRSFAAMQRAELILWVIDGTKDDNVIKGEYAQLSEHWQDKRVIALLNKCDLFTEAEGDAKRSLLNTLSNGSFSVLTISARHFTHADDITFLLVSSYNEMYGETESEDLIVYNARHFEALSNAVSALDRVLLGLESGISGELVSMDLRDALRHLAEITGEISSSDILHHVFKNFCIGK